MKIGIVTWFGTGNFGTDLQSYALCHYLKKQGHDVKLIPMFLYKNLGIKYSIRRFIGHYKRILQIFLTDTDAKRKRYTIIKKYKKHILPIYPLVTTIKQYKIMMNYFDCFITGSDQIWNPYHLQEFNLLDFNYSKPCFAYASSIGVNEIPFDKYSIYKKFLSKFKVIGVREKSGELALKKVTERNDITTVLDPTFLLTKNDWMNFSEDNDNLEFPFYEYMLVYTIGSRKNYPEYIKLIREFYGIDNVVVISSVESSIHYKKTYTLNKVSPMSFLKLIAHAKLVCTDSFHATALCINFNKNFIELLRFDDTSKISQNSRIIDLLQHYFIQDRIFRGNDELPPLNMNYKNVNIILEEDRKKSYDFIKNALSMMIK